MIEFVCKHYSAHYQRAVISHIIFQFRIRTLP